MRFISTILFCLVVSPALAQGNWTYYDNNADIRALHQVGDTLCQSVCVIVITGFIRQAAADMVRHDAAISIPQCQYQVAVIN